MDSGPGTSKAFHAFLWKCHCPIVVLALKVSKPQNRSALQHLTSKKFLRPEAVQGTLSHCDSSCMHVPSPTPISPCFINRGQGVFPFLHRRSLIKCLRGLLFLQPHGMGPCIPVSPLLWRRQGQQLTAAFSFFGKKRG